MTLDPRRSPRTWRGSSSAREHSRFAPGVLLVRGLRIGFVVTGDGCRFDAEADVDLVHQDLADGSTRCDRLPRQGEGAPSRTAIVSQGVKTTLTDRSI